MALNFCLGHHLQASSPYSGPASVGSREQRSQPKDSMSPANLEPLSKVTNKKISNVAESRVQLDMVE